MPRELFDKTKHDPVICPGKGAHAWVYRGKKAQRYVCANCGLDITKRQLKEETDGDPQS